MTNPFAPTVPTQQPNHAAPQHASPFEAPKPAAPQGYGTGLGAQQATSPFAAHTAPSTASAPTGFDMSRVNAAPAPVVGEGKGPKLADMYGRLVIMFPLKIEDVPKLPQYITADDRLKGRLTQLRLTATVVVLDDGRGGQNPIQWGGNLHLPPEQQIPHTDSAPLPYVRKAMWLNQSRVVSQARDSLPGPDGRPGVIVGRVLKAGPEQNAPYYLSTATETEVTLARQYLEAVQAGHVPHPLG